MRAFAVAGLLVLGTTGVATAQSWVNLTPGAGTAPAARRLASAIHDPVDNRLVIFGGFSVGFHNDIWAFDLDTGTWANLTPAAGPPAPAGRITPASIYEPTGHRMITWSGQGPGVFFNDVWQFDFDTNTWSLFSPVTGGPPQIRYGVGTTFDPEAGELVTFAGFTNLGRFDDVWRFNPTSSTWTDVSPGVGPEMRCLHAACYDSEKHRMIMYGGQRNGPLDDIWALDLDTDTWTNLTPVNRPTGRFHAAFVYDELNNRGTVFGGQGVASNNEAWVFDLWTNKWTLLAPTGTPPSARWGSAGIYDPANDRMIIFGGYDTGMKNDVWALEDLSGTTTGAPPLASALVLHPNMPNPFNPTTTIRFEMPVAGDVTLTVYDVRGTRVRTLVRESRAEGTHAVTWDGRNDRGEQVGSGVYLYRLDAAGTSQTRKMVLLK